MAAVTTYKCDVCGVLKQEANHWFRAFLRKSGSEGLSFILILWEGRYPATIGQPADMHLCGLQCATKAMHKAMEE